MKIAIYGGSFNPPHLGHIEAAKHISQQLEPDVFYIIPDNIPPHKQLDEFSPSPEERLEMCRAAFGGIENVCVSDMEIKREGKSYTADTVALLREQYPEDELFLCMSTDMFMSFRTWYRYQYLLNTCTLAVSRRGEDEDSLLEAFARELGTETETNIVFIDFEPLVMSSSDIRDRLRVGLGSDKLSDEVYSLIIKHRWYEARPELSWLREKAYEYLSPKRIAHVAGCESEAVSLAMQWGEEPEKAAVAGILHDITKKLDKKEQLILCGKYDIILDKAEIDNPKLLHARTGAAVAKDVFGIPEDVYEAIRWHTTGKPDMTLLEKIIYLADYIEPTRDFPGVDKLRELCYEDINAAMALGLKMSIEDIRSYGEEPFKDSLDAFLWYNKEEE